MELELPQLTSLILFAQETADEGNDSIGTVINIVGNFIYVVLGLIALWGAYCVVMVWSRVKQKRFRNEDEQMQFLTALDDSLNRGDFDAAAQVCEGDPRAMCQLAHLAISNRKIGFNRVRHLVQDRFQRDVLADLEERLAWVNTVIKTAPMVGLLGTVIGMMGAFAKLATAENVDPAQLASNIQVALITTACGLAIAIPLVMSTASIVIRIKKLEDLVGAGLTHFFDSYKVGLTKRRG